MCAPVSWWIVTCGLETVRHVVWVQYVRTSSRLRSMHSKAMNTPAVLVPLNASTSRTTQGWGGRERRTRSSRDTRRRTFGCSVG